MSFVGKIFILLIVVMSLVYMTIAAMVYATHKNWRDSYKELDTKHQARKQELDDAKKGRAALEATHAVELASIQRERGQIQEELNLVKEERNTLENTNQKLQDDLKNAVATMKASQTTLEGLRAQVTTLTEAVDTAREQRDAALKKSVEDEDKLAQQKGELARFKEQNVALSKQVDSLSTAMQDAQIQPNQKGAPRVEGVVLGVRESGLIEVSIGFDDGLQVSDQVEIFRLGEDSETSTYVGRANLIRVEKDRAVGQIEKQYQRSAVKVEDRVATMAFFARARPRPQE